MTCVCASVQKVQEECVFLTGDLEEARASAAEQEERLRQQLLEVQRAHGCRRAVLQRALVEWHGADAGVEIAAVRCMEVPKTSIVRR